MSHVLMRDETGGLANEAYFSNPIVSLKQQLSGLKTANYIVIFETSTFEIIKLKRVKPKTKISLGLKYLSFGHIKLELEQSITVFEISTLQFFKFQSFLQLKKFLNLGPKIPYLGVLGSTFEKLLSYLKSASSNLSCCKVRCENRNT